MHLIFVAQPQVQSDGAKLQFVLRVTRGLRMPAAGLPPLQMVAESATLLMKSSLVA